MVGPQHAHAPDKHGHFRRGQRQQIGLVDQQFLGRARGFDADIIAPAIDTRLEHGKACRIGLLWRGIGAAGRERHRNGMATSLGRRLNTGIARQHDQIGKTDLWRAVGVKSGLDRFEHGQHPGQIRRLIRRPVLLRSQTDTRPISPAALVGVAVGCSRGPCGFDQIADGQAALQNARLERCRIMGIDQRVINERHRVLPNAQGCRHISPQKTRWRPHIAVCQLIPCLGEGSGQFIRVFIEMAADFCIGRIDAQRQIAGQHARRMALGRVMRVGHRARTRPALGLPLMRASRAGGQLPLIFEQVLEVMVAPLCRRLAPRDLKAAGRGKGPARGACLVDPAEPLRLDWRRFRLWPQIVRAHRAMRLAKGVAARDQRHRLVVVHRHAGEGFADIMGRGCRVAIAAGPFGVDVNEPHLHRRQRVFEIARAAIARLVVQPVGLGAPIDVVLAFPGILAATGKARHRQSHVLERAGARQNDQIGPAQGPAIFGLDRPQQAARLVEVDVIGPRVERRKALLAAARAPAPVADPIGARAMPCHADEQAAVMPKIGRPPALTIGHQRHNIRLDGRQIERLEGLGIVERGARWADLRRVLVEDLEVKPARPPLVILV